MPDQAPRDFAATTINDARDNLKQLDGQVSGEDNLIRLCAAQARLAIAAALLDVADAIRSSAPGPVGIDLYAAMRKREQT